MPDNSPPAGEVSLEERVAHIERLLTDDEWAGRVIWRGGYPRVPVVDALPTAGEIYAYAMLTLRGDGSTTPDTLYICLRDSAGAWSWVNLTRGQYGEIDNDGAAAATTLTTAGTFYVLVEDTALSYGVDFDMPAEGRLRYTGTPTVVVMADVVLDFVSDTPNHDVTWQLRKNGSATGARSVTVRKGTAADRNEVSVHGLFTLATNEYLEVYVSSGTNAVTVTSYTFALTATVVGVV